MIDPIILSDSDSAQANADFDHWLNNEPFTLILVPGTGDIADMAVNKVTEFINSGNANYASVRVVQAPNCNFIVDALKDLSVNPDIDDLDLDNFEELAAISISNQANIIAWTAHADEFPNSPGGFVNWLVLKANSVDQ